MQYRCCKSQREHASQKCEVVIISLFYSFINSYTIPASPRCLQSYLIVCLPPEWLIICCWTAQLDVQSHALKYLRFYNTSQISSINPAYNLWKL